MKCPSCHSALRVDGHPGRRRWVCPYGHGRAANVPVLRSEGGGAALREVVRRMYAEPPPPAGRLCPSCHRPMRVVGVPTPQKAVDLDICMQCHLLWFDPGESEAFASTAPPVAPAAELPAEARGLLAREKARRVREEVEARWEGVESSGSLWEEVLGYFGVSLDADDGPPTGPTWVSWGALAAISLATAFAWTQLDLALTAFAVVPREPFAAGGLRLLAYALIHEEVDALLVNLVLLWVIGRRMEARLGSAAVAVLLVGGAVSAGLCHALAMPRDGALLAGAAGAVTALLTTEGRLEPRSRVVLNVSTGRQSVPLHFPYWALLAAWLAVQLLWAWSASGQGVTPVSIPALIGGVLVGLAWVEATRLMGTWRTGPSPAPVRSARRR